MKVATCRVHGELTDETAISCMDKHNAHGIKWKCIKCADAKKQQTLEKHIANGFKMPEVIEGFCRKHGKLNESSGFICFDKTLQLGYRIRCKECTHRIRANNYHTNREKNIKKAGDWKKENRQRVNEQVRLDRINNPEKYARWTKEYNLRNRDAISLAESLRKRKLDKGFYDKMMADQENKCAICNLEETRMASDGIHRTRLCIDHNHETGSVRELLCHDCNTGLGKFKDNEFLMLRASDYLRKHNFNDHPKTAE